MEQGSITAIISVLGVIGTISGVVLGWSGRARTLKRETAAEASKDTALRSDVDYIKRGVDEMRLEQKDQGRRFDALSERVTRVEESSKQAHKRLDRIETEGRC